MAGIEVNLRAARSASGGWHFGEPHSSCRGSCNLNEALIIRSGHIGQRQGRTARENLKTLSIFPRRRGPLWCAPAPTAARSRFGTNITLVEWAVIEKDCPELSLISDIDTDNKPSKLTNPNSNPVVIRSLYETGGPAGI